MISSRMMKALGVGGLAVLAAAIAPRGAAAQDAFKIGLIIPMTGHRPRPASRSTRP